jgi:hypothetical protein
MKKVPVALVGCLVLVGVVGAATGLDFDQARAWELLVEQVELGPRHPWAPAHATTRWWLVEHLEPLVDEVVLQRFTYEPAFGEPLKLCNIIGVLNPEAPRRVMIGAHWDTRRYADEDPLPDNRERPVPGANDGASGVAVLLELARVFSVERPEVGVVYVLFDAEDQGRLAGMEFAQGSVELAEAGLLSYDWGVVVDMIGDAELNIHPEGHSLTLAPELVEDIWAVAAELDADGFREEPRHTITDDHLPLLRAGLPTVVLIDFDYAVWHTIDDTPEYCSADSLGQVGRVLEALIRSEEP